MKEKITAFLNNLIMYDYILFGGILALFVLLIILAIVLRRHLGFAIFLVLLSFATISIGSIVGYIEMHKYIFKNSVKLTSQKKLHFTPAVVVRGKITNISKLNFTTCTVTASAFKVTKNKYKNMLLKYKPFEKMSMTIPNLKKGESSDFKMLIEPFTYNKDYNISLEADCL